MLVNYIFMYTWIWEAVGNKIKLPKIGEVKAKLSRGFGGKILNATVTRTASGKYYVSLCVEMGMDSLLGRNAGGMVGIGQGFEKKRRGCICTPKAHNIFPAILNVWSQ